VIINQQYPNKPTIP